MDRTNHFDAIKALAELINYLIFLGFITTIVFYNQDSDRMYGRLCVSLTTRCLSLVRAGPPLESTQSRPVTPLHARTRYRATNCLDQQLMDGFEDIMSVGQIYEVFAAMHSSVRAGLVRMYSCE